jgi:lactate dehydrogenase-like 2-hydroxyacid dehydrogenase
MKASKPKVLILGSDLDFIEKEYFDHFKQDYEVHVSTQISTPDYNSLEFSERQPNYQWQILHAPDRASTKEKLPPKVKQDGPFQALVIKMGTIPYEPYDEDLLHSITPDCEIIVSASAGYNEFDVTWMASAGIYFCNTVDAVSEATADMALFLILATVRNTTNAERQARTGEWKTGLTPSQDTHGKALGIVGMGAIGKYVALKANLFGMKILYFQRTRMSEEEEQKYSAAYSPTLHSLLEQSDIVSIHTPLNPQTEDLISHEQFSHMKNGSFLVNTARGAIVNEEALISALDSGKLARAGLDVFRQEPDINEYFRNSDQVVLQPHMGGLTESAFAKSQLECLENIRAYFEKGIPNSPVNDPNR